MQIFSLPEIESPVNGDFVQGQVPIIGNSDVEGFTAYEIDFAYQDAVDDWFLVARSNNPVRDGQLAVWDTTVITDGNYRLRMLVDLEDGRQHEILIENLRVRNYSMIETNTPIPGEEVTPTLPVLNTPTAVTMARSTPTQLPQNPVEVHQRDIVNSLIVGAGISFILIFMILMYRFIRNLRRRN